MLSDFLGNDLSRLSKELDKLALILPEKGAKRITPELVEQNIGISKEYNNFELIKALAMKDVLKANRIAQYFEKNPKSECRHQAGFGTILRIITNQEVREIIK